MISHRLLLTLAFIASCQNHVFAFQGPAKFQIRKSTLAIDQDSPRRRNSLAQEMAGRGMGMASPAKKKNGSTKKNNGATATTPFNVNASLSRLEKKYDELTRAAAKSLHKEEDDDDDNDIVTTEYVVAARAEGYVGDWVPIAQFCLARTASQASSSEGVSDPLIRATVSYYCREFSHVATLGSRVFQSVPRNLLQYAVESTDSFHKHVYETALQGKNDDANNNNVMTKQEARLVLNLSEVINGGADDASEIKRTYRTMSFQWHPDRFVGTDRSPADIDAAAEHYSRIKLAYETLTSGVRDEGKSWYQSLGGRARTDFVGPLQLLSLDAAKEAIEASGVATAVCGLDRELVQGFVARSQQ
jgi:DnaJ domain